MKTTERRAHLSPREVGLATALGKPGAHGPYRTITHGAIVLWIIAHGADGVGLVPRTKQAPSEATVEFGRRVREHREGQGLSQEDLAERCGVHWTFLGQVERGQRSIRLDNILKVAAGLGVEPGELLNGLRSVSRKDSA